MKLEKQKKMFCPIIKDNCKGELCIALRETSGNYYCKLTRP